MGFTNDNSIEFTVRKHINMNMEIWHLVTHFVVDGHHIQICCRGVKLSNL